MLTQSKFLSNIFLNLMNCLMIYPQVIICNHVYTEVQWPMFIGTQNVGVPKYNPIISLNNHFHENNNKF